jgi:hypothetical protein
MQKITILAVTALVFAACKKTDWNKVVSDMEELREKLCSCKESACIVDTEKKMKDLNTSVEGKSGRPNDLDKIFNGMRECEEKVAKREIVPTMTRYRDTMCACKDRDCAYGVSEGSKNALRVDFEHYEPTAEETKQLADIAKQTAECLTRATGGEGSAR